MPPPRSLQDLLSTALRCLFGVVFCISAIALAVDSSKSGLAVPKKPVLQPQPISGLTSDDVTPPQAITATATTLTSQR